MKEEREIRFKINDGCLNNLVEHIKSKGFELKRSFLIEDKYYDDTDYNDIKNGEGYRCRKINKTVEFTYKKKRNGKVFEEDYTKKQFYKKTRDKTNIITIKKKRRIFKKNDNCELIIDNIFNLGNYFEVECKNKNPMSIFSLLEVSKNWLQKTNKGVTEILLEKKFI